MLLKTLGFLTVTRHHVTVTHLCTLYCFWKTSDFATLIFTPPNKRLSLWSQLNTHAFRFSLGAWTPPSFVQLTGRRDFWWLCWNPESSLRLTDTPETASGASGKRGPLQAHLHQCSGGMHTRCLSPPTQPMWAEDRALWRTTGRKEPEI